MHQRLQLTSNLPSGVPLPGTAILERVDYVSEALHAILERTTHQTTRERIGEDQPLAFAPPSEAGLRRNAD